MNESLQKTLRILLPVAVHFCAALVSGLLLRAVSSAAGLPPAGSTAEVLLTSLICLPVYLRMWKKDREARPSDTEQRKKKRAWWFWLLPAAAGAACSLAAGLISRFLALDRIFDNGIQEELFSASLPLRLAGLCLLGPVAEELCFRGLTYERAREVFPRIPAVLAVSGLFALYHGNLIQILYAFPMALILQWIYCSTGSLAGPVAFHMGANLISVILEAL